MNRKIEEIIFRTDTNLASDVQNAIDDLNDLLDQEMVKVLDWVGNHCVPNFHMHQKWNSMGVTKYTSEQLKDLYKAEMNTKECG